MAGIGTLIGQHGSALLTFAAAALAAAALQPVRVRAGLLTGRLVYGNRATPYEVLTEFSGQVAGTGSITDVLPRMARMLGEATGAERAEVWMRDGRDERLMAGWPATRALTSPDSEPTAGDPTAVRDDETAERGRVFEVVHQGERLGCLRVVTSPREPLTPAAERLIQAVSGQAGLVLRNVALIEDVRSSRHRLVAAADEARRGLEQTCTTAPNSSSSRSINLGLVRQAVRESPEEAAELLAQTEQAATGALADLRDLAHGIYPPLLADHGLDAALAAQARKAPLPVTIEADGTGQYPQDTEAAVYFAIGEALQNVAKYAQATGARVTLRGIGRSLTFTVEDDGKGFDPATARMGTGVQGMTDRMAALGGTLEVSSEPGRGTRVTGTVPV